MSVSGVLRAKPQSAADPAGDPTPWRTCLGHDWEKNLREQHSFALWAGRDWETDLSETEHTVTGRSRTSELGLDA